MENSILKGTVDGMKGNRGSLETYRTGTDKGTLIESAILSDDDGGDATGENESDDQILYSVPSTPLYSESSIRHLIKHPANVPGRKDRILVVILVSLTFFVQVRIVNNNIIRKSVSTRVYHPGSAYSNTYK